MSEVKIQSETPPAETQTDVTSTTAMAQTYTPRSDVVEFEDRLELQMDLPGVTIDDVDVRFEDRALSITAERKIEETGFLHREFGAARFRRAFTLPDGYDAARIEAKMKDGVLTISVPKSEESMPRRIEVKGS